MIEESSATDDPATAGPCRNIPAPGRCRPENPILRVLRQQVADDAVVDQFIADFLALLDDRMLGLRQLLDAGRAEDSVTRLLSIETSSAMVGAEELAEAAAALIRVLDGGASDQVDDTYGELLRAAERARRVLSGD